jgi:hypothetical protein
MKQLLAAAFAACLFASPAFAQTADFFVKPDNAIAKQGESVCVPIRVQGFDEIVSLQFALHWDPTMLEFDHAQAFNLPEWDQTWLGITQAEGKMLITWSAPIEAITLSNQEQLIEVCFTLQGGIGACTDLMINGNGFGPTVGGAEVMNADSMNVWTDSSGLSSQICVSDPEVVHQTNLFQSKTEIYPNPAADWLTVTYKEAFSGEALRFEVLDLMGRTLRLVWLSGEKTEILMEDLPAGMYLWRLRSEEKVLQTGRIVRE